MTTLMIEADNTLSLEAQVRKANQLLANGDAENALALLSPLTSGETAFLPACFLLSMTAWQMGRLDWALDVMRDCHERWPMEGTVADVLASLYAQAGNLNESLFMGKLATALAGGPQELVELIPQGFPTFDWSFYHMKDRPKLAQARASLANGRPFDAIEQARQHAALNRQDGDAHAFLASLLLRAGLASVAVDVLKIVTEHLIEDVAVPAPYQSLYARALTAVGEFASARSWHQKAVAAAPEDAEIAAAVIADGAWLEESPARLRASSEDWVRHFCAAPKPRQWRRPEGKLVIGYIVSAFTDPLDIAAVAAVARAHDRGHVTVVGYGTGPQRWEQNAPLNGAFDTWHDISALDPATLARFFERGRLHLIVDAAGFSAPRGLMALARLRTAIRVSWLGNAAELGQPVYDARIAPMWGDDNGSTLWRVPGGYPALPASKGTLPRSTDRGIHFGADVGMAQLDDETVALWSSILQAQPDAKLLLRARDMGPGDNVERLIARFGRELSARIDIVSDKETPEFYADIDVALMPSRGVSPRIAAEALACGAPPVALSGSGVAHPYAAFLRDLGLGSMLVAADEHEYASIARALTTSEKTRQQIISAMTATAGEGKARDVDFATTLEKYALEALAPAEGLPS